MSSHYRISFSQIVGETLSFAGNQIKSFIKQRIAESLELHRGFDHYQGISVPSFWESRFSSFEKTTLPKVRKTTIKENTTEERLMKRDIMENITPQQAVVLNKIMNIASKQGYKVKASLPSPSKDLIIDLEAFDLQKMFKENKEKVFVKIKKR